MNASLAITECSIGKETSLGMICKWFWNTKVKTFCSHSEIKFYFLNLFSFFSISLDEFILILPKCFFQPWNKQENNGCLIFLIKSILIWRIAMSFFNVEQYYNLKLIFISLRMHGFYKHIDHAYLHCIYYILIDYSYSNIRLLFKMPIPNDGQ